MNSEFFWHYFGYQNALFLLKKSSNTKKFSDTNKEQILTVVNEKMIDLRDVIIKSFQKMISILLYKSVQ